MNIIYKDIQKNLKLKDDKIYAIFDGSLHEDLYPTLSKSNLKINMLFHEIKFQDSFKEVAPYLVQLDFNNNPDISNKLLDKYSISNCLVIISNKEFASVLKAIRDIFYININSQKGYLRFYDNMVFEELIKEKNTSNKLLRDINCYIYKDITNTIKEFKGEL